MGDKFLAAIKASMITVAGTVAGRRGGNSIIRKNVLEVSMLWNFQLKRNTKKTTVLVPRKKLPVEC